MIKGISSYSPELERNIVILYSIQKDDFIIETISILDDNMLKRQISEMNVKIEDVIESDNSTLKNAVNLIRSYLSKKEINLYEEIIGMGIRVDYKKYFKTNFSRKVIEELLKIGYGKTVSYSELASRLDSKAFRAVGNILGKNPYPLIIPCHRVIRKDDSTGGFMGSTDVDSWGYIKKILIEIEK